MTPKDHNKNRRKPELPATEIEQPNPLSRATIHPLELPHHTGEGFPRQWVRGVHSFTILIATNPVAAARGAAAIGEKAAKLAPKRKRPTQKGPVGELAEPLVARTFK